MQAKSWMADVEVLLSQLPAENTCKNDCDLPDLYGLPCKCWLYRCARTGEAILLSLVYPRWLRRPPEVVVDWRMSFDPDVTVNQYMNMTGPAVINIDSDDDDDLPGPSYPVPTFPIPVPSNRYHRQGLDLIEQLNF